MQKIACAILALLVLVSTQVAAQDKYKVSAVSVGSGETPISSGIAASVDLTSEGGGYMQVMAQAEQAWFMIGKDWKIDAVKCSLYASIGHFQSAPWAGPYAGCIVPHSWGSCRRSARSCGVTTCFRSS
jgi:hypothetical protein